MLVAVEMTSSVDWQANLATLTKTLKNLPDTRPMLVAVPEAFACFGGSEKNALALAQATEALLAALADLCREYDIWLLAGTIPMAHDDTRYKAASMLFNADGECVARYDKIHLFDVDVSDNTQSYRESDSTAAGDDVVVVDTPFGKIGLAVCYDVRFAGLFMAMQAKGADIITLPSAFTQVTGAAHWHTLIRARAIETQCYFLAPNQVGTHANGRQTYGHSLIVSPWGEVLAECQAGEQFCAATVNSLHQSELRRKMPVLEHAQFNAKWK